MLEVPGDQSRGPNAGGPMQGPNAGGPMVTPLAGCLGIWACKVSHFRSNLGNGPCASIIVDVVVLSVQVPCGLCMEVSLCLNSCHLHQLSMKQLQDFSKHAIVCMCVVVSLWPL